MSMDVSVVLPAYNEEACLEVLLRRIGQSMSSEDARQSMLPSDTLKWEIVVVDDGSADTTAAIARRVGQELPVRLIEHQTNQGLGAAMRTGLRAAMGSTTIVTMDADNTQDPALIPTMLTKLLKGADVVIASRFQEGGAEIGVPFRRRVLSHAASGIMKRVAPVAGARDYSCGYRAYRGELIRRLVERYGSETFITENGFACMVELLLRSASLGARVDEVPLVLRYDFKQGASKMRVARTTRRYASVVSAYRAGYPTPQVPAGSLDVREEQPGLRALNVGLAALGIVLTAPVMGLVALTVKLTSTGPVLTKELRVGKDRRRLAAAATGRRNNDLGGRPFEIIRFRTRHTDRRGSDRGSAASGRPPLTVPGQFLTRYRLDHLPELFNVMRGDMNLVGPRAPRPEAVVRLRDEVAGYAVRHAVRPGITGPAQLHTTGLGVADPRAEAEFDLAYVRQRSLLEDVRIMARTVPALFTNVQAA